ncbi:Phosphoglucan phosphatase LSF1, chloroplastic [Dirofilaria immitis]
MYSGGLCAKVLVACSVWGRFSYLSTYLHFIATLSNHAAYSIMRSLHIMQPTPPMLHAFLYVTWCMGCGAWYACFDLQRGAGRHSLLAKRFGIPSNCLVKIYGAVVYIATDQNCVPSVVRVQFGGGGDKGDVSVSRLTCITGGYVRRFWLKAPYGAVFHVYEPSSPVVSIAHGSDCGRGGASCRFLQRCCMIN